MKKTFIILITALLGFFGKAYGQQVFHTSATKVEYENGALKLTSKLITDDLEKAVGASVASKENFDSKARAYVSANFSMKVNGVNVPLSYIGSQTEEKSTRLYLKADNISNIKEIEIRNAMLIEIYPDQMNTVTFDVNGKRKSFTARKGNDTGKVTF